MFLRDDFPENLLIIIILHVIIPLIDVVVISNNTINNSNNRSNSHCNSVAFFSMQNFTTLFCITTQCHSEGQQQSGAEGHQNRLQKNYCFQDNVL